MSSSSRVNDGGGRLQSWLLNAKQRAKRDQVPTGILFSVAAGNFGPNVPVYPAACDSPNLMAVAGIMDGQIWAQSGKGHVAAEARARVMPPGIYHYEMAQEAARAGDLDDARKHYHASLADQESAAALFGLAVGLLLPDEWRIVTRLLVAWDAGAAVYLVFAFTLFTNANVARIRHQAALLDEDRVAFLMLTVGAAAASLGAIVAELGVKDAVNQQAHLALAVATIALSWTFMHTIFALHYAPEFYFQAHKDQSGLAFPGNEEPDYWDFLYFSVVIGMTSQVSDVAITCKPIRSTATAHGVLSFFFNATLLALMVNIAASALAG